ncbi:MAG TPA: vitamin K epoxide reductase family protein [Fimbriimonadaceae bacterium]|nr:vitamin K epoxide reductase family protein [Fimbriimonadaceae bacterium]
MPQRKAKAWQHRCQNYSYREGDNNRQPPPSQQLDQPHMHVYGYYKLSFSNFMQQTVPDRKFPNPSMAQPARLVLNIAGLFVAGILTWAHLESLVPPCGQSRSCELILFSPESMIGGVPVAALGAFYYLLQVLLDFAALAKGSKTAKRTSLLLNWAALALTCYLVWTSLVHFGMVCGWCATSAAIVVATLTLGHTSYAYPKPSGARIDFLSVTALTCVAIGGFVVLGYTLQPRPPLTPVDAGTLASLSFDELAPANRIVDGTSKADVRVVFFGDLMCPACRTDYPRVQALVRGRKGVSLVYRHFPLSTHSLSLEAAIVSELCAKKGTSQEFFSRLEDEKTYPNLERIYALAEICGVERREAAQAVSDATTSAHRTVDADVALAKRLHLKAAPTILLVTRSSTPMVVDADSLGTALRNMSVGKQ